MSVETDAKKTKDGIFATKDTYRRQSQVIYEESKSAIQTFKSIEQFIERQDLLTDPFEYDRSGTDPGLVLIFNHDIFNDQPDRRGSKVDVNEIITCFSRLGFNIQSENIFDNKKKDEILAITKEIASRNLSMYNSLIIFFLSHGEEYNTLHTKDDTMKTDEFWKEFTNCKHLRNKPKMFIFQACKGSGFATTTDTKPEMDQSSLVPFNTFTTNYLGADMLIVYSSIEGNVSFRDQYKGTWLIQELCRNFSAYGRRDDVLSLIIRTSKCICRNYFHEENNIVRKQMPIFISTLTKKFYLNRSKDRNLLIKLIQEQESIKKRVEDLEQQVQCLIDKAK